MDIKKFIYLTEEINKKRFVDAHAGSISRDEFSALNHFFDELEKNIKIIL